jgi:hypothetical protein
MALILYRRHRKECEAGYAEDLRSGEFDETRRGCKKCGCLIHASGTLAGKFSRKQTGKATWEDAKAFAAVWEKARSWDAEELELGAHLTSLAAPTPTTSVSAGKSITIERAVQAFKAEFSDYAAPNTQKKYNVILGKLSAFSDNKG